MIDRTPDRGSTRVAAIRGAIDVPADTPGEVSAATIELVRAVVERNHLDPVAIISAQFTVTPDVKSVFPAKAAREAGWSGVPMLCTLEIDVPGALPRCIRLMLHANLPATQVVEHVYLRGAAALRPDLGKFTGEE
jgi:chorismate mutase